MSGTRAVAVNKADKVFDLVERGLSGRHIVNKLTEKYSFSL